MILVRVTTLDDRTLRFAEQLRGDSGMAVACVVDERQGVQASPLPKIGVTVAACDALGLYCPPDFAWRCGDYAYYLARAQFPDTRSFWMIEYDVRFSGSARPLFAFFEGREDIDFLATYLRPADRSWGWYRHAAGREVTPYHCLFPITRLSARAIDALREKRIAQARQPTRRILWPNDESFVATTAVALSLNAGDINGFGPTFYDETTFTFLKVMRDDDVPQSGPLCIHHPVLDDDAFTAKTAFHRGNQRPEPLAARARKAFFGRLNRLLPW